MHRSKHTARFLEFSLGSIVSTSVNKGAVPATEQKEQEQEKNDNFRRLPRVGEGVGIEARDGVFVVLCTDLDRGTAEVLQMSRIRRIERGIPLYAMRILNDRKGPEFDGSR